MLGVSPECRIQRLKPGATPALGTDAYAGLVPGQVKKQYTGLGGERVAIRDVPGKARLQHVVYLLGDKGMNASMVARPGRIKRLRRYQAALRSVRTAGQRMRLCALNRCKACKRRPEHPAWAVAVSARGRALCIRGSLCSVVF